MKEVIAKRLFKLTNLKETDLINLIEIPPSQDLGDFSFPCFSLSKIFKKSPIEIAKEISLKISSKDFEKIEAKGPYLNFFTNKKILAEKSLREILKKKEKFGSQKISKEKVMVEFSQANTHKAFHIGHVRGTSLGESISKIFESCGAKVIRANYQGDTGMHVAKWLWCYQKFHKSEKIKNDESWIAHVYVEAVKRLSDNGDFEKEVEEINRKLEKKEDKALNNLWKKTRQASLDSFKKIYLQLNTKFDSYFFESEVESRGKEIALELQKKGIARLSDGATIIDLEKDNLGVWVLLRSDGTVLYSAKDLALAELKFKKYKIDKAVYVVGAAQRMHISQLFKVLEMIKFKQSKNLFYVPVTEVRLPSGEMSSRTGDNVLYSDFIEELKDYASKEIKKRHKLSEKEIEKRALLIAISSLKYSFLKQDANKPIIFNKEESISFEGNTGPYLLYTYARAKSILRKAHSNNKFKTSRFVFAQPPYFSSRVSKSNLDGDQEPEHAPDFSLRVLDTSEINDLEKSLILQLSNFPEIVKEAYTNIAPSLIANYAYKLAQTFNNFYHSSQVIGSEQENFRLSLVVAFSIVLKNSLNLLAIDALEEM